MSCFVINKYLEERCWDDISLLESWWHAPTGFGIPWRKISTFIKVFRGFWQPLPGWSVQQFWEPRHSLHSELPEALICPSGQIEELWSVPLGSPSIWPTVWFTAGSNEWVRKKRVRGSCVFPLGFCVITGKTRVITSYNFDISWLYKFPRPPLRWLIPLYNAFFHIVDWGYLCHWKKNKKKPRYIPQLNTSHRMWRLEWVRSDSFIQQIFIACLRCTRCCHRGWESTGHSGYDPAPWSVQPSKAKNCPFSLFSSSSCSWARTDAQKQYLTTNPDADMAQAPLRRWAKLYDVQKGAPRKKAM